MLDVILKAYSIDPDSAVIQPVSNGLINKTWKVTSGGSSFILQGINTNIFKEPLKLSENISNIALHLKEHHPDYLFAAPLLNNANATLTWSDNSAYRLMPFIENSQTIDRVVSTGQAYEASLQFGKFTTVLAGFDTAKLNIIIRDFHNLTLRYTQFESSIQYAKRPRVQRAAEVITKLRAFYPLVEDFEKITKSQLFHKRVTHHDTKISNVLFNEHYKGMCVIDLDTVMPGYFISDVGDMLRTYVSPATEEETDLESITIREPIFEAIVAGYFEYMHDQLNEFEKAHFLYSGLFLTYMQALRFITDYLNNDIYYGANHEYHNFDRACNQLTLLERMKETESRLQNIIKNSVKKNYCL